MKSILRSWNVLLLASCLFTSVGCASTGTGVTLGTVDMEEILSAAGFRRTEADTAEKLRSIGDFPQRILFSQVENDQNYYVYADAQGCRCLYVGDEINYSNFEQIIRQRGAERSQCIDDRLNNSQTEQWRTFGSLESLCGR